MPLWASTTWQQGGQAYSNVRVTSTHFLLQNASKIKQIWELWSMNVALAMSTWNDVAVTVWHHQSESSYQDWRRSSMTERFAYERRYSYGRKAPVPSTWDVVEALLRHEELSHLPDWLSRKAGVLGCISSHTILFRCWKEIFPNEDATRFDLMDELDAIPAKMPTMYQFASCLQDWMTNLVVAEEVHPQTLNPDEPRLSSWSLASPFRPWITSSWLSGLRYSRAWSSKMMCPSQIEDFRKHVLSW